MASTNHGFTTRVIREKERRQQAGFVELGSLIHVQQFISEAQK